MAETSQQSSLRSYALVTAAYWGFTITDGALRMLVLLYFHTLGYTTIEIALLFLFYEFFGVLTNLLGGWLGARFGVKLTLYSGISLQIISLLMLMPIDSNWPQWLGVSYVMAAQALSGIAKDLTKMSAKSAVRLVIPQNAQSALFKWVAILTGSKNALKGVGFFLGGLLLATVGFVAGLAIMAAGLALVLCTSVWLPSGLGRVKAKVKFKQLLSKSPAINRLSAARFFLFGARDVWFVVALPVFLSATLGWSFEQVGGFLALWVIGYGVVQAIAPAFLTRFSQQESPEPRTIQIWSAALIACPAAIAIALHLQVSPAIAIVSGLVLFGIVFAVNSAVHSYLVLAYTVDSDVSLNVGFYYMANAGGRLVGTVLSGVGFQVLGLVGCLWMSAGLVAIATVMSFALPPIRVPKRQILVH
ncbi:MAG: organoarsenical effux MFS transporter ArsJ [Cyanobacteria bacterium J06597_1]